MQTSSQPSVKPLTSLPRETPIHTRRLLYNTPREPKYYLKSIIKCNVEIAKQLLKSHLPVIIRKISNKQHTLPKPSLPESSPTPTRNFIQQQHHIMRDTNKHSQTTFIPPSSTTIHNKQKSAAEHKEIAKYRTLPTSSQYNIKTLSPKT